MSRLRSYSIGKPLVEAGEAPGIVGWVRSGFLRMQKTLANDRQHTAGLLVEGDMFGLVFDSPLQFSIEAATDAEVCIFRRAAFDAVLHRSRELERVVLLSNLSELDRARDWMIILSNQKVSSRVAGFLLLLCSRFADIDHLVQTGSEGLSIEIPISRVDLANLLGTRPESISRAFHLLVRAGHIAMERPDLVRILDVGALFVEAGEDDLGGIQNLLHLTEIQGHKT